MRRLNKAEENMVLALENKLNRCPLCWGKDLQCEECFGTGRRTDRIKLEVKNVTE